MSSAPKDLLYTSSHEWVRVEDGVAVIGITDHAQDAMGDLVYIELPAVGDEVQAGDEAGVVESVKAASDIYAPVTGRIEAINEELADSPELVNRDAFNDGWLFKIRLSDPAELEELLSAREYKEQCETEDE